MMMMIIEHRNRCRRLINFIADCRRPASAAQYQQINENAKQNSHKNQTVRYIYIYMNMYVYNPKGMYVGLYGPYA